MSTWVYLWCIDMKYHVLQTCASVFMWGSFYILEVQKYTAITDLIVASELLKKKKKSNSENIP